MTDTEAEAALLTLGQDIKWREYPRGFVGISLFGRQYDIDPEMGQYEAMLIAEGEEGRISPDIESSGGCFPTPIEAKAACERHYATGQW